MLFTTSRKLQIVYLNLFSWGMNFSGMLNNQLSCKPGSPRFPNYWRDIDDRPPWWIAEVGIKTLLKRFNRNTTISICHILCSTISHPWLPWRCQVSRIANIKQESHGIGYTITFCFQFLTVKKHPYQFLCAINLSAGSWCSYCVL